MKMKITQDITPEQMKDAYTFNQSSLCMGRTILYKNIRDLFLQMKLSMDGARVFSPIGNKTIFKRFMSGHASELVNTRFLMELIEAFDFNKEELAAMLCTEISFSGVPKMLPFDKSQIPTKAMVGAQLKKLIDTDRNRLTHFTDLMQNQIRMAEAGKTYLDVAVFVNLLLAYDLDPAEEILKLRNLKEYLDVDPNYQAFEGQGTRTTVAEVLEFIEYLVQKSFDEKVFLVQNIEWAFHRFDSLSPDLIEQLLNSLDMDKKVENLLSFFTEFLNVSSSDLLYQRLEETWKDEEAEVSEDIEKEPEEETEKAEDEMEITETSDEGENTMDQEVTININGKYFVPCEKNSWKNENPNPNGEGFYWEIMPEDMAENIRLTLMRFDLMEASMNSVRKAVLKFCGDTQIKAQIQVIGNGYELLFCCAS